MSAVRVIGIGSPHGADCAGWVAIEALRRAGLVERCPAGSLSLHQCKAPAALYQALAGSRCAIVIDAVHGPPRSLLQLSAQQLQTRADLSSVHGIGVGEMLALVAVLQEPAPALTVLGIGVDPQDAAVEQLIERLLPELVRRIERIVAGHLAAAGFGTEKCVGTAHN